jgi:hypothetical protein
LPRQLVTAIEPIEKRQCIASRAKLHHLELLVLIDPEIRRAQIAMDHVALVQAFQSERGMTQQSTSFGIGQPALALEPGGERFALQILERQEVDFANPTDLKRTDDVRVVELGGHAHLALHAGQLRRVVGQRGGKC